MRDALTFMCCENRFIPAFGFEPRGFVYRKPGVVADLDALTMVHIFMSEIAPLSRQIDLRESWTRDHQWREQ